MEYRVDRSYQKMADLKLAEFFGTVGDNCSKEAQFAVLKKQADDLLLLNANFKGFIKSVSEGDMREKANRDNARTDGLLLCNAMADVVNDLAKGDLAVITAAGFKGTTPPSKDRPMGVTKLIEVAYDPKTGMVKIRCTRADKAADYLVDVSKDNVEWEESVYSIPLTNFPIQWRHGKGNFFIRLCPRDRKGKRGVVSNLLPITIY